MRLISWNCQGAFRNKVDYILPLQPDILVVQECEKFDYQSFHDTSYQPNDFYWYGDFVHKGIGIFSYSNYKFELHPDFNPEFRYILPFQVEGYGKTFTVFAIWAMEDKVNRNASYIGQIWRAINYYKGLFDDSTILIGDFNSNKIWDKKNRVGNHTDVVNKLIEHDIFSVYHRHYNIEQGEELHPTFFLQKNKLKPYHIDYCFASSDISRNIKEVEIGSFENWIKYSDHVPISIKFNI